MGCSLTVLLFLIGCKPEPDGKGPGPDHTTPSTPVPQTTPVPTNPNAPNVIVVVIDDLSAHQVGLYGSQPNQPPMPRLEQLADRGVRFENAYAFPSCSPARGAMLTGRMPSRFGLGNAIEVSDPEERWSLPLSEVTLAEALRQSPLPYKSYFVGKWHLVSFAYSHPAHHAIDQGFDWFEGSLENLGSALEPDGRSRGYFHFEKAVNGRVGYVSQKYATTVTTDDALAVLEQVSEPFLMVVSYNAPHVPIHVPPRELHTYSDLVAPCGAYQAVCYNASVEALDTEMGRLFDSMDQDLLDRTTIIVIADNGTPKHGIQQPFDPDRDKGTVYDGGVRVPLVVSGPLVRQPGTVSEALVSIMDIFATVAEIAGVDVNQLRSRPTDPEPVEIDAVSFLDQIVDPAAPGREFVFSELTQPLGPPPWNTEERMVRQGDYKLRRRNGVDELFRYGVGQVDEGENLLAAGPPSRADQVAYEALSAALDAHVAETAYRSP